MPTAKSKKTVKAIKTLRQPESTAKNVTPSTSNPYSFTTRLALVALFGVLCYLVAFKYRGLFLAGTVNSFPVTRLELNNRLVEKYGKTTFDEIVNEKLLNDQIKKNNIVVTDEEVKVEMDKLIKQYGNEEEFKSALAQFNLTPEKAQKSIKQSLGFKKLIEKTSKVEISDESVKKYFEENKATYKDKKLEDVAVSIKDSLYQQELFTKSQEIFTKIRTEAKVNSFIQ